MSSKTRKLLIATCPGYRNWKGVVFLFIREKKLFSIDSLSTTTTKNNNNKKKKKNSNSNNSNNTNLNLTGKNYLVKVLNMLFFSNCKTQLFTLYSQIIKLVTQKREKNYNSTLFKMLKCFLP